MKMTFEYGKEKFIAELSDTEKSARIAFNLAWKIVDEKDKTKLIFMPDLSEMQPYPLSNRRSLMKELKKKAKENEA